MPENTESSSNSDNSSSSSSSSNEHGSSSREQSLGSNDNNKTDSSSKSDQQQSRQQDGGSPPRASDGPNGPESRSLDSTRSPEASGAHRVHEVHDSTGRNIDNKYEAGGHNRASTPTSGEQIRERGQALRDDAQRKYGEAKQQVGHAVDAVERKFAAAAADPGVNKMAETAKQSAIDTVKQTSTVPVPTWNDVQGVATAVKTIEDHYSSDPAVKEKADKQINENAKELNKSLDPAGAAAAKEFKDAIDHGATPRQALDRALDEGTKNAPFFETEQHIERALAKADAGDHVAALSELAQAELSFANETVRIAGIIDGAKDIGGLREAAGTGTKGDVAPEANRAPADSGAKVDSPPTNAAAEVPKENAKATTAPSEHSQSDRPTLPGGHDVPAAHGSGEKATASTTDRGPSERPTLQGGHDAPAASGANNDGAKPSRLPEQNPLATTAHQPGEATTAKANDAPARGTLPGGHDGPKQPAHSPMASTGHGGDSGSAKAGSADPYAAPKNGPVMSDAEWGAVAKEMKALENAHMGGSPEYRQLAQKLEAHVDARAGQIGPTGSQNAGDGPKLPSQSPMASTRHEAPRQPAQSPMASTGHDAPKQPAQSPMASTGHEAPKQPAQSPMASTGHDAPRQPAQSPMASTGHDAPRQPAQSPMASTGHGGESGAAKPGSADAHTPVNDPRIMSDAQIFATMNEMQQLEAAGLGDSDRYHELAAKNYAHVDARAEQLPNPQKK